MNVKLDRHIIDEWNKNLMKHTRVKDAGELIDCLHFDFGDGIEVDIILVNGCEDSGPYIDAVLFDEGNEISCLEPNFECVAGQYEFKGDQTISLLLT